MSRKDDHVIPARLYNTDPDPAVLAAMDALRGNEENGDLWMELGLAYAKQYMMRDAVEAYSRAIACDPFKGIYYRHRGHRFISCWQFKEAAADFTMASRLIPDNWDVWYHLGLSWYLLGEYEKAEKAYKVCYELSEREDKLIAISDWYWNCLTRLGKKEEADKILENIRMGMDAGENIAYYRRLLMYKGHYTVDELMILEDITDVNDISLDKITQLYGVANYMRIIGQTERARDLMDTILEIGSYSSWAAFGYLAAMQDRKNLFN